jgi:alanyl-tRNA synthetase
VLQGVPNNYETDLIFPIVSKAAELAGIDYHTATPTAQTALKVVGDHTRAVVYLISDGVLPSNVGRGYVVRRLLRRVVMKVMTTPPCQGWGLGLCIVGIAG